MVETFNFRSEQSFAEVFRQYRGKMSRRTFSGILGINEHTVTSLEIGTRNPPRKIGFYERMLNVPDLTQEQIAELVKTQDGPRWLEPDNPWEAKKAAQRFGSKLLEYRNLAGLSQMQLASTLKLDEAAISRFESGDRKPPKSNDRFDKLPEVLQLSPEQFAQLILTSDPPRWLMPDIYQMAYGVAGVTLKTSKVYEAMGKFDVMDESDAMGVIGSVTVRTDADQFTAEETGFIRNLVIRRVSRRIEELLKARQDTQREMDEFFNRAP